MRMAMLVALLVLAAGCTDLETMVLNNAPDNAVAIQEDGDPIEVVKVWLYPITDTKLDAHARVKNATERAITAFKIRYYFYDAYGDRLRKFGFGEAAMNGISQRQPLAPGEERTVTWEVFGYDTAVRAEAQIYSVLFADGEEWTR